MESTRHSLTARGRYFGYEVAGASSSDVVLFVHGSGFTGAMWMPFARSLEPRMRSVMVDLLGHGQSERLGKGEMVGAEVDVAMLEEVARREAPSAGPDVPAAAAGRVHVVGHSYGAVLAARLALQKPSLVRSLVLIEPVLFGPLRAERPADCVDELDRLFADGKLLDPASAGTEAWSQRFYDYWTGPGAWSLLTLRQRELQMEVANKSFCEVLDVSNDPRPFSAYAALPKPLLLVGGGRSTRSAARILTRLGQTSGAVVHVVPSATHFLPITHGPELMEMLLRLWAIPQESVSTAYVGDSEK